MKDNNFYKIFRDSLIDAAIKSLKEIKSSEPTTNSRPKRIKKRVPKKGFNGGA